MNIDIERISQLMATFDSPDSSLRSIEIGEAVPAWQPAMGRETAAFIALTSKENRELLKAWYSRLSSINPHADTFRRILERATGEEIPLGRI